jgi:hypothetical protein
MHLSGLFGAILLALYPTMPALVWPTTEQFIPEHTVLLGSLALLALVVALPCLSLRTGVWHVVACLLLFVGHLRITIFRVVLEAHTPRVDWPLPFLLSVAGLGLVAGWPLLVRRAETIGRKGWLASILLFPALLPVIGSLNELDPVLLSGTLAALAGGLLLLAQRQLEPGSRSGGTALPGLALVALGLAGLTIARQVDHGEWLVALSLLGPAGVFVGLRYRSRVSVIAGQVAIAIAGLGLMLSLGGSHLYPDSRVPLFNWTGYMSGMPVLSAVAMLVLLQRAGGANLLPGDASRPAVNRVPGVTALFGALIWITLQVLMRFEEAEYLRPGHDFFNPLQTRDLAISAAWIGYALLLLGLGMLRRFPGVRQASLAVLLVTLTKLFLRDLGELSGLFLVGAVAGLAASLLLVSVLYQRFVFPRPLPGGEGEEPEELSEAGSPPHQG